MRSILKKLRQIAETIATLEAERDLIAANTQLEAATR